jgi:hypothetical protein
MVLHFCDNAINTCHVLGFTKTRSKMILVYSFHIKFLRHHNLFALPSAPFLCSLNNILINRRCLLGVCSVYHYFEPSFRRTSCLHLQGSIGLRFPQLYYRGNTVTEPLHKGILLKFEGHCLLQCFYSGKN